MVLNAAKSKPGGGMECVFVMNRSRLICGVQEQQQPGEQDLVLLAKVPGPTLRVEAGYPTGVDNGIHQVAELLCNSLTF